MSASRDASDVNGWEKTAPGLRRSHFVKADGKASLRLQLGMRRKGLVRVQLRDLAQL